jgi:hypothetical protein
MGLCHYHLARGEDKEIMQAAIKSYNNAIVCNPENSVHFFNRGNVRINQGLFEEACEDFE